MATVAEMQAALAAREAAEAETQPQTAPAPTGQVSQQDLIAALNRRSEQESVQRQAQQQTAQETGPMESFAVLAGRAFNKVPEGVSQFMMEQKISSLNDKVIELQPLSNAGNLEARQELLNTQNELGTMTQALGMQAEEQAEIEGTLNPLREENPVSSFLGEMTGGAAAVPLPGIGPRSLFGSKVLGSIVRETTTGAIAGGLEFTREGEDRISNILMGGALSGTLAPLSEIGINFVRAHLKKSFGKNLPKNLSEGDIENILKEADRLGIDVRAEDLTENAALKDLAESFESSTGAIRAGKRTQVEQQQEALNRIQSEVTEGGMSDPNTVVSEGLRAQFKTLQKTKNNMFNKSDKLIETLGDIPRLEGDKAIIEAAEQIFQIPKNVRDKGLMDVILTMSNTPKGDIKVVKGMIKMLEDIEDSLFTGTNSVIGKSGIQFITPIRAALQRDIDNMIDAKAATGDFIAARAKTARRGANKFFKDRILPFKKTQMRRLVDADEPESIVSFLLANSTDGGVRSSRAAVLHKSLDQKGKKAVRNALFERAVNTSFTGKGGERQFDSRLFSDALSNLENATKIFFTKREKRAVDGLKAVLDLTSAAPRALNKSVEQSTIGSIAALPLNSIIDFALSNPATKPLIAGLGRVDPTGPQFSRLLNSLVRVIAREQTPAARDKLQSLSEGAD